MKKKNFFKKNAKELITCLMLSILTYLIFFQINNITLVVQKWNFLYLILAWGLFLIIILILTFVFFGIIKLCEFIIEKLRK